MRRDLCKFYITHNRIVSNLYPKSNEPHFEVYYCLPSEVRNLCLYHWQIFIDI